MHDMLIAGVCYHHAGLQTSERQLVENLFLQNDILVLSSTTTLGSGVNLPARCVIVKGTTCWNTRLKCNEELDQTTVTQMIGRAGRPQFDNKGVAVVMTKTDMLRHYSVSKHRNAPASYKEELTGDSLTLCWMFVGVSVC